MNFTAGSRHCRLVSVIGGGAAAALIGVTAMATLAEDVHAAGAAPSPITDDQIAQAGLGVMAFNLRNLAVDPITEPCPMLTQDQVGAYFAQQGYTPNFTQFAVDSYYEDDIGDGYPGVDCISDIDAHSTDLAAHPDVLLPPLAPRLARDQCPRRRRCR